MTPVAFGGDADLGLIRSVAAGHGVSIVPEVLAAVRRQRAEAVRALAGGQLVYGVNTGMGALSSVRLTEEQQRSHQRNLLLARAAGGPPWLSEPEVRAVVAGARPGRERDDERILLWHRGLAILDIAVGLAILRRAEQREAGTMLRYR